MSAFGAGNAVSCLLVNTAGKQSQEDGSYLDGHQQTILPSALQQPPAICHQPATCIAHASGIVRALLTTALPWCLPRAMGLHAR